MTATAAITAQALRLLAAEIQAPDDVPACCLRDAADLIYAQAAEIERLRSIQQDIGGIGGCADGSGMRAVAAVADANKRADKAEDHVAELEGLLLAVKCGEFSGITCDNVNGRSWFDARDAALPKRSAE